MKRPALAFAALFAFAVKTNAQKLPTLQSQPFRAPETIRIDGKPTEWNDKYQAYNNHIEAFYTIANDDQDLYLIVKATTHDVADKIIRGGVTLMVDHTETKNDPDAVSVTFPILRGEDMSAVSNMFARKSFKQDDGVTVSMKELNDLFQAKSKVIEVKGVKTITDKEISVYNDSGIKAAILFDDTNALIYELAIPLKYLNLPNDGAESFSYQVKVNEEPVVVHITPGGKLPPPVPMNSLGTTDLWGVYKLVKK